jgi:DNA-binding response OmpR family regulator
MAIILIIEDNEVISRLWQITLQAEGFHVETAASGKDGIEMCKKHNPSVVLLDLIMPDMDGFQVFKKLREDFNPPPSVIVLSNLSSSQDIQKARAMGAEDFIIKSTILPEQLVAKVKGVLARGNHAL